MALSQKQLFSASQLFMASGKAGLGFDLSRFVGDEAFRAETLASLVGTASTPVLQAMVAQAIVAFTPDIEHPAPAASRPAAAPAPAAKVSPPVSPPEKPENRYIGRLR